MKIKYLSRDDDPTAENEPTEMIEKLNWENGQIMVQLAILNEKAKLKSTNKKALAQLLIDLIDQYSNKLDGDLNVFENELKLSGDYEAPKGIAPDSEVCDILLIARDIRIKNAYYLFI